MWSCFTQVDRTKPTSSPTGLLALLSLLTQTSDPASFIPDVHESYPFFFATGLPQFKHSYFDASITLIAISLRLQGQSFKTDHSSMSLHSRMVHSQCPPRTSSPPVTSDVPHVFNTHVFLLPLVGFVATVKFLSTTHSPVMLRRCVQK